MYLAARAASILQHEHHISIYILCESGTVSRANPEWVENRHPTSHSADCFIHKRTDGPPGIAYGLNILGEDNLYTCTKASDRSATHAALFPAPVALHPVLRVPIISCSTNYQKRSAPDILCLQQHCYSSTWLLSCSLHPIGRQKQKSIFSNK